MGEGRGEHSRAVDVAEEVVGVGGGAEGRTGLALVGDAVKLYYVMLDERSPLGRSGSLFSSPDACSAWFATCRAVKACATLRWP